MNDRNVVEKEVSTSCKDVNGDLPDCKEVPKDPK